MIFLVCLAGFPLLLPAQQVESDALYLNNGSVLRGRVLESIPGKGVKIEIVGNNVLVIPENEIRKMVMREATPAGNVPEAPAEPAKPPKLEFFPQVHLYGGSDQSWGFTGSLSYALPYRISAGLGTGVDWFSGAMLPVFGTLQYKLFKGTLSPFVYGQAGYAFPLESTRDTYYYWYQPEQNNHGGVMAGVGAGIRKDLTPRTAVTFSMGYRYQESRMTSEYNPWYNGDPSYNMKTERIEKFNRLVLSFGMLFR